jgi:outer membrane lipoprotein SlyB
VGGTSVGAASSSVAVGSTTGSSVAATVGSVAAGGWVVAVEHPVIRMMLTSMNKIKSFVRMSSFSFYILGKYF